jgi:hypothetical protein
MNLRMGFFPRHTEFRERNPFFRGITKSILSLFFRNNPSLYLTSSFTVDIIILKWILFLHRGNFKIVWNNVLRCRWQKMLLDWTGSGKKERPVIYSYWYCHLLKDAFKGTQDWDFCWLRFWNLYYFFISYVKILRFYKKFFLIRPLLGEIRFFRLVWD